MVTRDAPVDLDNSTNEADLVEDVQFIDLGDAKVETKQGSPVPIYMDNIFSIGSRP